MNQPTDKIEQRDTLAVKGLMILINFIFFFRSIIYDYDFLFIIIHRKVSALYLQPFCWTHYHKKVLIKVRKNRLSHTLTFISMNSSNYLTMFVAHYSMHDKCICLLLNIHSVP